MLSCFLFLFDFFEYLKNILKKKSKFILWDCIVTFHRRKKWNGFWEIATYPAYCVGDLAVLSSHRVWNYLSGHCQLIYHPSSSFSSLYELYAGILYISSLNYDNNLNKMRYAEDMKWTKIRGGKTAKGKYMMSLYLDPFFLYI